MLIPTRLSRLRIKPTKLKLLQDKMALRVAATELCKHNACLPGGESSEVF